MLETVAKGFIIGLLVSSPMGPINMLTIQRTLERGRWHGFVTGLGAMLSDITYAVITIIGLSFVSDFLNKYKQPLQIIGSIILVLFGIGIFSSKSLRKRTANTISEEFGYLKDFISSFLLTFSNVAIVLVLLGLYARFSFNPTEEGSFAVLAGLFGFAFAALLWWFLLTTLVSRLRKRLKQNGLIILNRVIGTIFVIIGLGGILLSVFPNSFII